MVREYRRRCNTVENIRKVIGSWDSVIFVRETEERTACPITKGNNNTHFHISLIFVLYFLSQFQRFFYKQRDTSFELSSILWTVDLSKHLITAWTYQKFIQLDNFVTFRVFFVFFGSRVRLNLYERALSCFREIRLAQLRGNSVFKTVRARIYAMQSISLR